MILYLNTWLQSDAQVPYEDIRYEYEEWPQIKHSRRFTVFMHYVLKEKNLKKKLNILFLFICILNVTEQLNKDIYEVYDFFILVFLKEINH